MNTSFTIAESEILLRLNPITCPIWENIRSKGAVFAGIASMSGAIEASTENELGLCSLPGRISDQNANSLNVSEFGSKLRQN